MDVNSNRPVNPSSNPVTTATIRNGVFGSANGKPGISIDQIDLEIYEKGQARNNVDLTRLNPGQIQLRATPHVSINQAQVNTLLKRVLETEISPIRNVKVELTGDRTFSFSGTAGEPPKGRTYRTGAAPDPKGTGIQVQIQLHGRVAILPGNLAKLTFGETKTDLDGVLNLFGAKDLVSGASIRDRLYDALINRRDPNIFNFSQYGVNDAGAADMLGQEVRTPPPVPPHSLIPNQSVDDARRWVRTELRNYFKPEDVAKSAKAEQNFLKAFPQMKAEYLKFKQQIDQFFAPVKNLNQNWIDLVDGTSKLAPKAKALHTATQAFADRIEKMRDQMRPERDRAYEKKNAAYDLWQKTNKPSDKANFEKLEANFDRIEALDAALLHLDVSTVDRARSTIYMMSLHDREFQAAQNWIKGNPTGRALCSTIKDNEFFIDLNKLSIYPVEKVFTPEMKNLNLDPSQLVSLAVNIKSVSGSKQGLTINSGKLKAAQVGPTTLEVKNLNLAGAQIPYLMAKVISVNPQTLAPMVGKPAELMDTYGDTRRIAVTSSREASQVAARKLGELEALYKQGKIPFKQYDAQTKQINSQLEKTIAVIEDKKVKELARPYLFIDIDKGCVDIKEEVLQKILDSALQDALPAGMEPLKINFNPVKQTVTVNGSYHVPIMGKKNYSLTFALQGSQQNPHQLSLKLLELNFPYKNFLLSKVNLVSDVAFRHQKKMFEQALQNLQDARPALAKQGLSFNLTSTNIAELVKQVESVNSQSPMILRLDLAQLLADTQQRQQAMPMIHLDIDKVEITPDRHLKVHLGNHHDSMAEISAANSYKTRMVDAAKTLNLGNALH